MLIKASAAACAKIYRPPPGLLEAAPIKSPYWTQGSQIRIIRMDPIDDDLRGWELPAQVNFFP